MASGQFAAQEKNSSSVACDLSIESDDNLNAVLRTPLFPQDPGFSELLCRRAAWWDTDRIRSWLLEQGYIMYHLCRSHGDYAALMYPVNIGHSLNEFPFANLEGLEPTPDSKVRILSGTTGNMGNIAYAQNAQGQHVVFKAVLDGSEEFRILSYLHNQGVPRSIDDFHHVIPVLDILPREGHWLGVMPRWGVDPFLPGCEKLEEVFHIIHCLLKGLTYLHKHRIAHGDIKADNILVNHVYTDFYDRRNHFRRSLRSQGKLTYAFFDFDGSTMFPSSISLDDCRLPSHISYNTLYDQVPGDTLQAELDFNPFAFDVGMLGVTFCKEFQHMTRTVPMLAPLFDRMTTRNIARRFKASEALQFFEEQVVPLTPKRVLSLAAEAKYHYMAYDYYNRWKDLDPDFVAKWAAYREPPVPYHIRFLREICLYPWIFHTVTSLRRIGRLLCRGLNNLKRALDMSFLMFLSFGVI